MLIVAILNSAVKVGLIEKVNPERKLEEGERISRVDIWKKNVPCKETVWCKDPVTA